MSAAIHISGVTKTFGAKTALDDVSLEIPRGQIFGFLGPNGAGKTTAIRCLMDFIRPDAGSMTILGKDARRDSPALKHVVGYLSSEAGLHPHWTAKTHIDFLGGIKGRGRADELVKLLELDTGRKVSDLSSGNRQKLAIVLAFLGRPELLIMDEPTRALDPLLQNQLYRLLKDFAAGGGTVFFSSHNLSEVQQICDGVAVIKDGRIVAAEAMQDILNMNLHSVKATAKEPFRLEDFSLKGVEVLTHNRHAVSLKVSGNLDAVMKLLARYHVTDVEITHASLEDAFMEYYS